jgi:pSer/pThr/pTyr-binding forkhead associated (FHA) protein
MTTKSEKSSMDHLIVNHPDGNTEKVPLPEGDKILRIGRELDNDVVLTDPRTSRYTLKLSLMARFCRCRTYPAQTAPCSTGTR